MTPRTADEHRAAIAASGMNIYSPLDPESSEDYIPTLLLEDMLNRGLVGLSLEGLAPRTRSKRVKESACRALGYPVPASFEKRQPRFTGQDFDTYNQQALNLQIWNEPIISTRRYALVRIGADGIITQVKVVPGSVLIPLDKTGTLTTKYQALLVPGKTPLNLLSSLDTQSLLPLLTGATVTPVAGFNMVVRPTDQPSAQNILPIGEIFRRLSPLVGQSFPDVGRQQDRTRGAELHRLVCEHLGYTNYQDNGQFPDVRHQLLEVKLQTSGTIDLGQVLPESIAAVRGVRPFGNIQPRHCDTRYALFAASVDAGSVLLTHLYVVTGADFFHHFRQFQGKVINKKIQIPLPRSLFGE